jgi:hypothetical protein
MAYIRKPTVLEYGTLNMYSISSSDSGHKAVDNLKCASNGVFTDFTLCILKQP